MKSFVLFCSLFGFFFLSMGTLSADPVEKDHMLRCGPSGTKCTFDSDCCSKNCVNDPKLGKLCKAEGASWTCVPSGHTCTFDSDCCSKNCVNDPKIGKVCKPEGASWTCMPPGQKCIFDSDCCSKDCVSDMKRGKICH